MPKRTVCRSSRSGRFAAKAKCRAFKKTKVTIRRTTKAGQFLLILGGYGRKKGKKK